MIRTVIVEVEVDEQEFASLNAKRHRQGVQQQTPEGMIENQVVDALQSKLFPKVSCRQMKLAPMRNARDIHATS